MPSSGHSLLGRIERGIGVGHRLGDENAARSAANRAGRSARRATTGASVVRPVRDRSSAPRRPSRRSHCRGPARRPAGRAGRSGPSAGTFSTGSTCSSIVQACVDLGVEPGLAARTGNRDAGQARTASARPTGCGRSRRSRQPALVERELLPRLDSPTAIRRLHDGSSAPRVVSLAASTRPRLEPALAVQRARVAGHVRREPHLAAAEGETAAADAVDVGHEREAGGVEDLFERTVAFAQYRPRGARRRSIRTRKLRRQSKGLAQAASLPAASVDGRFGCHFLTLRCPHDSQQRQLRWG